MDLVPLESFPKHYPFISPSLMKPEWGDPLKFEFNLTLASPSLPTLTMNITLRCWTESLI